MTLDLDQAFAGVDERTEGGVMPGSSEVENGARVKSAQNVRFTGRSIETRCGYLASKRYDPRVVDAYSSAYKNVGAGRYVDANEVEYLLQAREWSNSGALVRRVYLCRDNAGPAWVPAGTGLTYTAATQEADLVRFSQLGGDVVMWRRDGGRPWLWDGDRAGSFQDIGEVTPNPDTPSYYHALPVEAEFGIAAADRLVFPCGVGEIGYTDILDARRWDDATARLRIGNDGGAITGLALWRNATLLVFKARSVWAVDNWRGDLADIAIVKITDQAGCVAHDTITQVGGDIIWLGNGGVYRLQQVLDNDRQLAPVPVSFLIPRTMGRVNWSRAHLASAALARGVWTLAVPLDGATVPDTLLVWSAESQEWQGTDVPGGRYALPDGIYGTPWGTPWTQGEYLGIHRVILFGQETVGILQKRWMIVQGWGHRDLSLEVNSSATPTVDDIATSVRFRGYHAADHGVQAWAGVQVETEELGTEGVTLGIYTEGRHTLVPVQGSTTRDRTRWKAWGRVTRDLTNADDDFDADGREDYSWPPGGVRQKETATVVGTITGAGNATVVFTAAGVTGSPITLSVAVLLNDTAAQVSVKIVNALTANAAINAKFAASYPGVSGDGTVTVTRRVWDAVDATLNISIANGTCTGLTAAPTSASTTTDTDEGDLLSMETNGVTLGRMQAHTLQGPVIGRARTMEPVVSSTAGRLRINVIRGAGVPVPSR